MKIRFVLPSNNYNIVFSKNDLLKLLKSGHIVMTTDRTDCTASRAVFNKNGDGLTFLDQKEVHNGLMFSLSDPVADMKDEDYFVQFLSIILDSSCKELLEELRRIVDESA